MPAVSRSKRTIYVHIPKTGGTAITTFFYQHGLIDQADWERWYRRNNHETAVVIQRTLDTEDLYDGLTWKDFFTFSVVRNPFDRLISFWLYKKREGAQPHHRAAVSMSFPDFACHMLTLHPDVLRDQGHWLVDRNGDVLVDRLIRLESLSEEWADVCRTLGVPAQSLNVMNRTAGPCYDHDRYYDRVSRELVEDRYSGDLTLLGYDYVPGRAQAPKVVGPVVQFCPTLGDRCGIGTYTEMLSAAKRFSAVSDLEHLDGADIDVLHVQHEYGIMRAELFEEIVQHCDANGTRLFVTLHRVERTSWTALIARIVHTLKTRLRLMLAHRSALASDSGGAGRGIFAGRVSTTRTYLAYAKYLVDSFAYRRRYQRRILETTDGIIVHAQDAKQELLRQGAGNVQVVAHPLRLFPTSEALRSDVDGKLHVGYFGFLSGAKDLTRLIEVCAGLPDTVLHLLASVPQAGIISQSVQTCIALSRRFEWLDLNLDFLPLDQVVYQLSQNDVNVYLTNHSPHGFSSSGSIRQYLAAGRPIVANASAMVSDLADVITLVPNRDAATLARAIREFDEDTSRIEAYARAHTWDRVPDVYGPGD